MSVYNVHGAAVQNASNLITWMAWVEVDGQVDTGASDCTVTLYSADGDNTRTAVSGATETVASPIADGTFNGSMTVNLTAGVLYYYVISITSTTAKTGFDPIVVPVRTS